jgi:predicted O-linked N-acetylglucosamine transferase (SPINDLY family)
LDPDDADTRNTLGHALYEIGDSQRGLEEFRRAAQTPLASGAVMSDYGGALRDAGQMSEALAWLRRAVELQPATSEIHNNLANVLIQQGRADEAVAELREAIRLLPTNVTAHSNLLFALHLTSASGEEIAADHRTWGERHADPMWRDDVVYSNSRAAERRLKIGYVSPDFRDHPVGRFAWAVLSGHDREQFDVTCYSSLPSPAAADQLTERMRQAASTWRDVRRLSDEELAQQIRDDQIDVLVDLAGHSAHHRLLAFARRPAPVQITWLGYPNTTGMRAMAWRLTDACADPPGMTEALHTEQLLRLPRCAWCFTPPEVSPEPARSSDNWGVTFGSFNSLSKLNDELLRLWGRVLTATPGSRLLLKAAGLEGEQTRQRVMTTFNTCGIASERIEMLPPAADFATHLATYSQIDVALDAYPYHGTTTTCEALWMGVPVVTLAGQTHVSRVGVSLLSNVGLPDLVANDAEQYVQIASTLAGDASKLAMLRSTLRQRMGESPLMDARGFVKEFEDAIRMTWKQWCESR